MYLDLAGKWKIELTADSGVQAGEITLPGSLQGAGYGNPVTLDTPWVSGLHDAFWYEQEPFKKGDGEECRGGNPAVFPRHTFRRRLSHDGISGDGCPVVEEKDGDDKGVGIKRYQMSFLLSSRSGFSGGG